MLLALVRLILPPSQSTLFLRKNPARVFLCPLAAGKYFSVFWAVLQVFLGVALEITQLVLGQVIADTYT
jgi:hypothetical protein